MLKKTLALILVLLLLSSFLVVTVAAASNGTATLSCENLPSDSSITFQYAVSATTFSNYVPVDGIIIEAEKTRYLDVGILESSVPDGYEFDYWKVNGTTVPNDSQITLSDKAKAKIDSSKKDLGFVDDSVLELSIIKKNNTGVSWNITAVFKQEGEDGGSSTRFTPVVKVSDAEGQCDMGSLEENCLTYITSSENGCLWKLTATPLSSAYALNYIQIGEDETTRAYSEDGKTITWEVTNDGAEYIAWFTADLIRLGDTIYYAPAKDSSSANFTSSMASKIYTGQMVRIAVPYSVLGETSGQNLSLQVYAGEGTTGQLLYDGALVKNFVVASMPQISKLTVVAKYNDSEPSVKTYDIQVGTPGTMELTNTKVSGNGYGVAAFWNEADAALNLYYATSSGVYHATTDGIVKMDGTQGEAIAAGGASEDALYAITTTYDYSSAGYTYYLTYHLYEYVNDQWSQLDDSYAVKETDGMDYTKYQAALIMNGSSIWLGEVHWDGDSWENNDVSFNSFWKADADTAYAGSSNGVYQYKNGSWTQISGTSGTMYITSGACTGETVTMVTADARTSEIDRIDKRYYNEKTNGTIKKVVISDSNAIVTAVDTSAIPVCSGISTVSMRQFVGVAADGALYAITDGKETVDNQFLSYSGSYLYKLVDGVWVYQDVPAYNNSSKDYIRHFTSPCEGVTVFLGFQGCNYIYYSGQTTITFDSNGGSKVDSITGTIGSTVTAPKSPTKDGGFVFLGWYSDKELKNAWTWNVMPAKDVTLYAKWLDRNNPGASEDLDKERERAKAGLDAALARLTKTDYSDENWQKVLDAYNAGLEAIDAAPEDYDAIYDALNEAIANMLAVKADRADSVTVAISMETFVLGDYPEYDKEYGAGYIIEPTLVEVPKYTKVSTIITDLLIKEYGEEPQPWTMTGTVENDFYLASVLYGDKWLGEFDCGQQSGWMYSVNNVFPNVGASAYTVSYGDVIRWQYTASGLGADLGTSAEWAEGDVAVVAVKDKLTWKVAEVNKILEENSTYLGGGVLLDAYNHAYDVLTEHHSTQAEVDAALAQLNNAEAAKPVIDQINAIGEVTLDSKDDIDAARAAYDALTEEQKALVGNYQTLLDAEASYEAQLPPVVPGKLDFGTAEKTEPSIGFSDVASGDWFADAVSYVYQNGLMNGTGDGKFSPNANTTRGMIVTILARLEGVDTTTGATWYEAGRQWAMKNGISDGTSMDGQITREQLATMLCRYAQLKGRDTTARADLSAFADASGVSDWAEEAMQWAVAKGLIQGSSNQLTPTAPATRAQVATILMRFIG